MNIHKNARTTPQSRGLLVHRVLESAVDRFELSTISLHAEMSTGL